jgi:transposase
MLIGSGNIRGMWNPADSLHLTVEQKQTLGAWIRTKTTPQRIVLRSRICLLAAEGLSNNAIAHRLKTSRPTVPLWRKRFNDAGPSGLSADAPHGPSAHRLSPRKVRAIVEATLHTPPPDATHWSTRAMANAQGVSHASVARIWDAHGLQPHRIETFKLSKDTRFVEKLTDVVGVYLNPPDKAVVLCVDEKSQVQALDRTQPGLPMKKGRCGTVIGTCYPRHRHEEFLKFLRTIDQVTPHEMAFHLIPDNYGTHNHPNVKKWLVKHPRFHLHFTPTSASWLNRVKRWFGEITRKRIRRGVFTSVPELVAAIDEFIRLNNKTPKPFV